jgi:WD40 repeat protein
MSQIHTCLLPVIGLLLLPCCPSPRPALPEKEPQLPSEQKVGVDLYGDALPDGALARLGTVRLRHSTRAVFVGFPDDKTLVSLDRYGTVLVWETTTGKKLRQFSTGRPPLEWAQSIALSPDGKSLAWLDDQNSVPVLEVATGKERFRFVPPSEDNDPLSVIDSLAFTDNGKVLVIGGTCRVNTQGKFFYDQTLVRFLDTATGKELRQIKGAVGNFATFAVTPDGKTLALLDVTLALHEVPTKKVVNREVKKVVTWEVQTGKKLREFPIDPKDNNIGLAITPDGKNVAIVSFSSRMLRRRELATGKELPHAPLPKGVKDFVFRADGKMLALVHATAILLHDTVTGKEAGRIELPFSYGKSILAFAPGGKLLAVAGLDNTIRLFDVATGKEVLTAEGHEEGILSVSLAPAGKLVATAAEDRSVRVWDPGTGKQLRRFSVMDPINPQGFGCLAVAFAPDGKTVSAGSAEGIIRLWDAVSGKVLRQLGGPQKCLLGFAFAPGGKIFATGDEDDEVRLWDLATGKELRAFRPAPQDSFWPAGVRLLAFSPDGRILAAARVTDRDRDGGTTRSRVHLWEVATGKELRHLTGRGLALLRFAPDGKALAVGDHKSISLVDIVRGKEIRLFGGQNLAPESAVFSPDGKLLFAGCLNGKIRFWEVATGTLLGDIQAHRGAVLSLDVSADGKRLISGSLDTTALVWDLPGVIAKVRAKTKALSPKQLEALWADLAAPKADRASRALSKLVEAPAEALPFLKKHLQPVRPADPKQLARLLADLGSDELAVREKATKGLEELGDLAAAALRELLDKHPPEKVREGIETLLDKLEGPVTSPELLRGLRAVEVLEWIGSPEAQQQLQALAKGAAGHRLTEEARAALQRLEKLMP